MTDSEMKYGHAGLQAFFSAGRLFAENKIAIKEFVIKEEKALLYFVVDTTECSIVLSPLPGGLYRKAWYCTCLHASTSGYAHNNECKHIRAAEYWLVNRLTFQRLEFLKALSRLKSRKTGVLIVSDPFIMEGTL
jgi:hypothetical protein